MFQGISDILLGLKTTVLISLSASVSLFSDFSQLGQRRLGVFYWEWGGVGGTGFLRSVPQKYLFLTFTLGAYFKIHLPEPLLQTYRVGHPSESLGSCVFNVSRCTCHQPTSPTALSSSLGGHTEPLPALASFWFHCQIAPPPHLTIQEKKASPGANPYFILLVIPPSTVQDDLSSLVYITFLSAPTPDLSFSGRQCLVQAGSLALDT